MIRFLAALILSCCLIYLCLLFLALFRPDDWDVFTTPFIALVVTLFSYWIMSRYK